MKRWKFTLPVLQEKLECLAGEAVLPMSLRTASVCSGPMPPLLAASERRQEYGCVVSYSGGAVLREQIAPFQEKWRLWFARRILGAEK